MSKKKKISSSPEGRNMDNGGFGTGSEKAEKGRKKKNFVMVILTYHFYVKVKMKAREAGRVQSYFKK